MGCKELIEALRREGEENSRIIRLEAEAEAARIRAHAAGKISRTREDIEKANSAAVKEQTKAILSEAGRKARMVLLSAEKELSDRLYAAAVKALPRLRERGYPEVFEALVHELPPYDWQVVRVNPTDEENARKYFPGSRIIPDKGIIAGLDVMDNEGEVRVTNTFEKRLENAWADVLPESINDVYGGIAGYGVPEKN